MRGRNKNSFSSRRPLSRTLPGRQNGARARDIIAGHRCGKRFASCHPQAHDLFGAVWRRHWLLRWRSHRSVLVQRPGVREQKRSQTLHLRGRWRGSSLSFLAAVVALVSRAHNLAFFRLCGFELTALRHRPTPLPAAWAAEGWAAEDRDSGLSSTPTIKLVAAWHLLRSSTRPSVHHKCARLAGAGQGADLSLLSDQPWGDRRPTPHPM